MIAFSLEIRRFVLFVTDDVHGVESVRDSYINDLFQIVDLSERVKLGNTII
jgi:hypothetical protein